ncbi:hypothetical protein CYLTODRAFT_421443 [Cylindrobasidium torrendii FP15055 ss-10]|uniref:Methyltransferase domain-containing protein n=1 Tax=Cylindrobasidium torrendii FP15055 ss-10 TaxID=1314674 RepID=A0A0D7BG34_9AGAR|nr:hypothetical protein CYLTODRAFT_421443 [Cylindrobasidium torrendii FP15055 ss-10]
MTRYNPPPFSKREYWDDRFKKEKTFDWLLPAHTLDAPILEALAASNSVAPRLLHIGCGTSTLSFHLRTLVESPDQIHNTDYSSVAVDAGARWEEESFQKPTGDNAHEHRMSWSTLDLLCPTSIGDLRQKGQLYDIIVDKSTSDAISCGDDLEIALPYVFCTSIDLPSGAPARRTMHPLHLLAVHLAALARPGARWIVLSYSAERFPFLPPFPYTQQDGLLEPDIEKEGFPHPAKLWRLEKKEALEAVGDGASDADAKGHGIVHKPKVSNWLYVMSRTDVVLV